VSKRHSSFYCAVFLFHRTGEGGFGYKISSPAGIFIVELTALFVTLLHIGEVIQPPEKCMILTDSLSSVKALLSRKVSHRTHPMVYECKQMCNDVLDDGVEVEIIEGNENMDKRAEIVLFLIDHFRRWIFRVWQDLFC
jgi:hypothetical protein